MSCKFLGTVVVMLLGGCGGDVIGGEGAASPFWPSTSTVAQAIDGVTRMRVAATDVLVRSGPQSFALGRLYQGEAFDISYRSPGGWAWGYAWGHVNGCVWVQLAQDSGVANLDLPSGPPSPTARSCGPQHSIDPRDFSVGDADLNATDGQMVRVSCPNFDTWDNWNSAGPQPRHHVARSASTVRLRYTVRGGGGAMVRLGPEEWVFMRRACIDTRGAGPVTPPATPPVMTPTPPPPSPPCEAHSGIFGWNCAGPIAGMNCVRLDEESDPDTWDDNYVCTTRDIGLRWSHAGAIPGMRCTQLLEDADPHTWNDNYLCVPDSSEIELVWSMAGPIPGRECLRLYEPADPHTWDDNYLCLGIRSPPPPPPCGGHTQACCPGDRCNDGSLVCHGGQCINHRCCALCSGRSVAHQVMVSSDCEGHARSWCAREDRGNFVDAFWGYCEP